jgi:hypothetical protein
VESVEMPIPPTRVLVSGSCVLVRLVAPGRVASRHRPRPTSTSKPWEPPHRLDIELDADPVGEEVDLDPAEPLGLVEEE